MRGCAPQDIKDHEAGYTKLQALYRGHRARKSLQQVTRGRKPASVAAIRTYAHLLNQSEMDFRRGAQPS